MEAVAASKDEPSNPMDTSPDELHVGVQYTQDSQKQPPSRRYSLLELIHMGGGAAAREQLDSLQARLRQGALLFQPSICKPRCSTQRELDYLEEVGIQVVDWNSLKTQGRRANNSSGMALQHFSRPAARARVAAPHGGSKMGNAMKMLRAVKTKANGSGRTYTSKYRGVHQTFPTKRWEAQFRRNGKPTSLGCFDHEEEAARAYDKMMLWCELHNAAGVKSGITNFDPLEYEKEFPWLQSVTQDELIESLRSEGRRQAAHRMLRQKREGATDAGTDDYDDVKPDPPPAMQQQQLPSQPQSPVMLLQPELAAAMAQLHAAQQQQQQQQEAGLLVVGTGALGPGAASIGGMVGGGVVQGGGEVVGAAEEAGQEGLGGAAAAGAVAEQGAGGEDAMES